MGAIRWSLVVVLCWALALALYASGCASTRMTCVGGVCAIEHKTIARVADVTVLYTDDGTLLTIEHKRESGWVQGVVGAVVGFAIKALAL